MQSVVCLRKIVLKALKHKAEMPKGKHLYQNQALAEKITHSKYLSLQDYCYI